MTNSRPASSLATVGFHISGGGTGGSLGDEGGSTHRSSTGSGERPVVTFVEDHGFDPPSTDTHPLPPQLIPLVHPLKTVLSPVGGMGVGEGVASQSKSYQVDVSSPMTQPCSWSPGAGGSKGGFALSPKVAKIKHKVQSDVHFGNSLGHSGINGSTVEIMGSVDEGRWMMGEGSGMGKFNAGEGGEGGSDNGVVPWSGTTRLSLSSSRNRDRERKTARSRDVSRERNVRSIPVQPTPSPLGGRHNSDDVDPRGNAAWTAASMSNQSHNGGKPQNVVSFLNDEHGHLSKDTQQHQQRRDKLGVTITLAPTRTRNTVVPTGWGDTMESNQPQPFTAEKKNRFGRTDISSAGAGLGVSLLDIEADGPLSSSHTITFSEEMISAPVDGHSNKQQDTAAATATTTEDDSSDDCNRDGNSSISPSYKRLKALRVTGQLSRPIIYDETLRPFGPKSNGL